MAPSGGKTDDQVSPGYNRESYSFVLHHWTEKLGLGLARPSKLEKMLKNAKNAKKNATSVWESRTLNSMNDLVFNEWATINPKYGHF